MLSQDLIVAPTQSRPPALIEGSGRKARDRIEHFLRAAIDNDNTRRAYGNTPNSRRNRCSAKVGSSVPGNETAHAVACGNGPAALWREEARLTESEVP